MDPFSFSNWDRVAMPELLKPYANPRVLRWSEQVHLWITVHAMDLPPGRYSGHLLATLRNSTTRSADRAPLEQAERKIPFEIEVLPFRLPQRTSLLTTNWKHVPGPPALAEVFAQMMQEYYVNLACLEPPDVEGSELRLDKWDWEARARIMARRGIVPNLVGVYPFDFDYEWYQGRLGQRLKPKITDDAEIVAYFKRVAETLRTCGHNAIYAMPYDEPGAHKQDAMLRSYQLIKEADRSWRNINCYTLSEGLSDGADGCSALRRLALWSDSWCSNRSGQVSDVWDYQDKEVGNYELYLLYRKLQRQGHTIWYYHNTWRACNHPGKTLGWCRADGYYIWKYGLNGFPTADGGYDAFHAEVGRLSHKLKPFSVPAECQPMQRTLFVEPNPDGSYTAVASKRLEAFRDGVKDHMYLVLLENLTGQALGHDDPTLRGLGRQGQHALRQSYEAIRQNPYSWHNYQIQKDHLAQMILKLQSAGLQPEWVDGVLPNQHSLRFEQTVHHATLEEMAQCTFSSNLLTDPSFEHPAGWRQEWKQEAGTRPGGKDQVNGQGNDLLHVTSERARSGNSSLRCQSPAPPDYAQRWVNVGMYSTPQPVRAGDILRAAVHVHLPAPLADTDRGALLNVVGWTAVGEEIASWGPGMVEVHSSQPAQEWQELKLQVKVEDPRMKFVQLRLGLAGRGRCDFDDAVLQIGRTE